MAAAVYRHQRTNTTSHRCPLLAACLQDRKKEGTLPLSVLLLDLVLVLLDVLQQSTSTLFHQHPACCFHHAVLRWGSRQPSNRTVLVIGPRPKRDVDAVATRSADGSVDGKYIMLARVAGSPPFIYIFLETGGEVNALVT
jgi:hypothetical protein